MGIRALLCDVVAIYRPTLGQSDTGAPTGAWAAIAEDVPCRLHGLSDQEKAVRGIMSDVSAFNVYFMPEVDVKTTDRLFDGTDYYEVTGVDVKKGRSRAHHLEVGATLIK